MFSRCWDPKTNTCHCLSPVVGNSGKPRTAEPQIGGRAGVTKVAQEVQPGKDGKENSNFRPQGDPGS